jgi:YD repeat-containing protein
MSGGTALATYVYDENGYVGDLTTRSLANGTQSTYLYDPLDRVTWLTHTLNGTSRGFNYEENERGLIFTFDIAAEG